MYSITFDRFTNFSMKNRTPRALPFPADAPIALHRHLKALYPVLQAIERRGMA